MEPGFLPPGTGLLDAFRLHYNRFQSTVAGIIQNPTDAVVIARLGDDLDEYTELVHQVYLQPASFNILSNLYRTLESSMWLSWQRFRRVS